MYLYQGEVVLRWGEERTYDDPVVECTHVGMRLEEVFLNLQITLFKYVEIAVATAKETCSLGCMLVQYSVTPDTPITGWSFRVY